MRTIHNGSDGRVRDAEHSYIAHGLVQLAGGAASGAHDIEDRGTPKTGDAVVDAARQKRRVHLVWVDDGLARDAAAQLVVEEEADLVGGVLVQGRRELGAVGGEVEAGEADAVAVVEQAVMDEPLLVRSLPVVRLWLDPILPTRQPLQHAHPLDGLVVAVLHRADARGEGDVGGDLSRSAPDASTTPLDLVDDWPVDTDQHACLDHVADQQGDRRLRLADDVEDGGATKAAERCVDAARLCGGVKFGGLGDLVLWHALAGLVEMERLGTVGHVCHEARREQREALPEVALGERIGIALAIHAGVYDHVANDSFPVVCGCLDTALATAILPCLHASAVGFGEARATLAPANLASHGVVEAGKADAVEVGVAFEAVDVPESGAYNIGVQGMVPTSNESIADVRLCGDEEAW